MDLAREKEFSSSQVGRITQGLWFFGGFGEVVELTGRGDGSGFDGGTGIAFAEDQKMNRVSLELFRVLAV